MGQQQRKQRKQQQRKHLLGSSRGRAEALLAAATLQKCEITKEGTWCGEVGQLQQQQQQQRRHLRGSSSCYRCYLLHPKMRRRLFRLEAGATR